jgi:hypothetical protein
MSIWVNYEVLRRGLDLDLGTMQLDREGLWIDPGTIGQDYGQVDPWLRQAYADGSAGAMLPGFGPHCPPGILLPGSDGSELLPQPLERDPVQDLPPAHLLPQPAEEPPADVPPGNAAGEAPSAAEAPPPLPPADSELPLIPSMER